MKTSIILAAGTFAAAATAATTPSQSAVDVLLKIAPTSSNCDLTNKECATAQQAAGPLIDSFAEYGITTPGEQAALLALVATESGAFKYNRNHFPDPGTPGQGTRNMMSVKFVAKYAEAKYPDAVSISDPAQKLDKVIELGGEWASAAWFYTTYCDDTVKTGLKAGTEKGYEDYLTICVGTGPKVDDTRKQYYALASKALGLSGQ